MNRRLGKCRSGRGGASRTRVAGEIMAESRNRNPRAAGAVLAFAICAGALVGAARGQPTIGVLAGAALGIAIAIVVWLVDRRRA